MSTLEAFFRRAGKLKHLKRTGWVKKGISSPESVADHTFRVALITMAVGNMKQQRGEILNLEKALSLSLLHDLPESYMGDLDLETKERLGNQKVTELEHEAVTSSLEGMPKKLRTKYEKMFREYQNQSTPEAQLVKQIDYVEMLLQAREYSEVEEDRDLKEFWKDWKNHTYDEDVRLLLQNLLKDFH